MQGYPAATSPDDIILVSCGPGKASPTESIGTSGQVSNYGCWGAFSSKSGESIDTVALCTHGLCYVHVCVSICMFVCLFACAQTHIHLKITTICIHVCIYVYIYSFNHSNYDYGYLQNYFTRIYARLHVCVPGCMEGQTCVWSEGCETCILSTPHRPNKAVRYTVSITNVTPSLCFARFQPCTTDSVMWLFRFSGLW